MGGIADHGTHGTRAVKPTPDSTLREARTWLQSRLSKGEECPCCRRLARVYRRRLDSGNARALLLLVGLHARGESWIAVHVIVQKLGTSGIDLSKAARWGLIEAKPSKSDPTKRASGWWRPTQAGIAFALGHTTVAKWAEVYDGKTLRLDHSQRVHIREALGKRFNYSELLETIAQAAPNLTSDGRDE